jgi:Mg2+/Co2+ transporter CorC
MLVDLFVLYEIEENFDKKNLFINFNDNEDEENICTSKSNQTYSINGDDNEDDINEFFILNNNNEQITTGGILQTSTNHDRQMVKNVFFTSGSFS